MRGKPCCLLSSKHVCVLLILGGIVTCRCAKGLSVEVVWSSRVMDEQVRVHLGDQERISELRQSISGLCVSFPC